MTFKRHSLEIYNWKKNRNITTLKNLVEDFYPGNEQKNQDEMVL